MFCDKKYLRRGEFEKMIDFMGSWLWGLVRSAVSYDYKN